jgi:NTP pyrophosphatase (non-canonical NTP hydrolase)
MPTGAAVGAALVLAAISDDISAGRPLFGAGRSAPDPPGVAWPVMDLAAFQQLMADTYGERDRGRGVPATVAWLTEELGELAQAVRKGDREAQVHELGDVLAWLASLAGQLGIDLDEAAARYADGCPRCGAAPCRCP